MTSYRSRGAMVEEKVDINRYLVGGSRIGPGRSTLCAVWTLEHVWNRRVSGGNRNGSLMIRERRQPIPKGPLAIMNVFRVVSKQSSRSLTRASLTRGPVRSFHSPFAVLSETSPLTVPPAESGSTVSPMSPAYEKGFDDSPDPVLTANGTHTYVVSQPDPADSPYEVPSGAYPTSAPYVNYTATEKPETLDMPRSSTSPNLAHPTLTRAVPTNESGVGDSAAVRHRDAPGELGAKGGSDGGLGLMDKATTKGENTLGARNPQPIQEAGEKYSKLGVKEAWKQRL